MNKELEKLEKAIFAPRKKNRIYDIRQAYQEYQAEKRWGWLKRIWGGSRHENTRVERTQDETKKAANKT